ncbi:MAG TPA: hypothetical protein VMS31_12400 [Pyrinomonadaceae bacterium]|nr:hypothetical protein [Pyrinomonadaceae bacterium]
MRLRALLISTAIMSLTVAVVKAINPPVPSPLINEDKILGSAYYDTLSILSTPNECSDFFGGPTVIETFNALIGKVRKDYFSSAIGIRMSGSTVNVVNVKTRKRYRLFDKVSIYANGPFYRRKYTNAQAFVSSVGKFGANTKEARVLMLLHELGHSVKSDTGGWLLPDDGMDDSQSRDNTRKIEDVCGEQIKGLGKGDIARNSVRGKYEAIEPDETDLPR